MSAFIALTDKPEATAEQLAQADRLDGKSADALRAREESFERCDTDGFLSQWADGLASRLESENARILRDGGYAEFPLLVDSKTGEVVGRYRHTFTNCYGGRPRQQYSWRVEDEYLARCGRKWIPACMGGKSRIQKQLGLEERTFWMPAYARIVGTGHGLSGQAWVAVLRKDDRQHPYSEANDEAVDAREASE
jgi:hypothetical protein